MNPFAGSITFKGNVAINLKNNNFNIVKNLTLDGNSSIYFYGETELKSKDELLAYFKANISQEVLAYDLSISPKDRIEILDLDEIDGEYSTMTVSGIETDFEEVLESFVENEEVVCVREGEINPLFGTKDIKVDIIP